jgi:hypothetical protein
MRSITSTITPRTGCNKDWNRKLKMDGNNIDPTKHFSKIQMLSLGQKKGNYSEGRQGLKGDFTR